MDIEKFTDRARGFLQAAQTIAIREFHQQVTPTHLLKARLEDPEGAASGLIRAAGGDAAAATADVTGLAADERLPALRRAVASIVALALPTTAGLAATPSHGVLHVRGKSVVMVFAMQGWGNWVNTLLIMLMLLGQWLSVNFEHLG